MKTPVLYKMIPLSPKEIAYYWDKGRYNKCGNCGHDKGSHCTTGAESQMRVRCGACEGGRCENYEDDFFSVVDDIRKGVKS